MYAEIFLSTELESYIIDRFPRIEFHACRYVKTERELFSREGVYDRDYARWTEKGGEGEKQRV